MKLTKNHRLTNILFPRTVDELFQQFWGEPDASKWTPSIDVKETDEAYVLAAELPGIDAADVELTLTSDTLTIEGEKKSATESADVPGHIVERRFGKFSRSFTFPSAVATDEVIAESKRGVLTITVKKAEAGKTRRIEIQGE